jgi:tRNA modification GTPase
MSGVADTIVASATPPGRGGIGIVRISGPETRSIGAGVLGQLPAPRHAAVAVFSDGAGQTIDVGLAIYFPAPNSFTGEDVLELHGHGGPVVMDLLLARVLELGARTAAAGEFTERAFLNGRLDLAQAEAVADLIDSGSAQAARAAVRSLHGEFSELVRELAEQVLRLRMWVEAAIDFPEEEVDFLADQGLRDRLEDLARRFARLDDAARQGALLRDGLTLVIAGRPNAGKSSLLNRLAGYEAAIVAAVPGTTRDVLRERIEIDGLPLHVLDTAGLRAGGDEIEREGMRRAEAEIARADRVLYVVDAADRASIDALPGDLASLPPGTPATVVMNKLDLAGAVPREEAGEPPRIHLSAATGAGLDLLRTHLKACAGFATPGEGTLSARRRHLDALRRARGHVDAAEQQLEAGMGELVAQELNDAQQVLGEITGEVSSEDLLGRIFANFCIGK